MGILSSIGISFIGIVVAQIVLSKIKDGIKNAFKLAFEKLTYD